LGAVITAVAGFWWQVRIKSSARLDLMSRYKDSILWTAFDLQSRIWNILNGYEIAKVHPHAGLLRAFLDEGTDEQVKYVRSSTAYVFAEYLGCTEAFRRDVQFLDLGRSDRNKHTMLLISNISETMSTSSFRGPFMIFRSDQRGIGELMISPDSKPGERRCLGYAEFCRKITQDEEFAEWMQPLLDHVDDAARDAGANPGRLTTLQHQLVELIEFLDPNGLRLPADKRQPFKVS
jgi:hypothetical protein